VSSYLVTGGAGFIGSALVRRLVAEGASTVVNVDKLTYAGGMESLAAAEGAPGYHFARADVCDAETLRALFARFRPQAVLHLAAESHVDRSIDAPAAFVHTNVVGTFTVLREAHGYWVTLPGQERETFRLVLVSSDEVYGSLGATGAFTETSPHCPNSPYAATKAAGDHLGRAWYRTYGLPVITTHASNNYGPFQFPEKLIPLVIQGAVAGTPLPVYGQGANVRDWLYVEDHVDALLAALARGRPGERYNVGGGAERTNLDVVRAVCALVDELAPDAGVGPRERLIRFVTDRPGHDFRYALDTTKAARELAWRPRESFDEGLRKTVRWYLDNRDWCARVREAGYGGERLGLGVSRRA
jgi:dTDP-glucose 4,6-dehydratase